MKPSQNWCSAVCDFPVLLSRVADVRLAPLAATAKASLDARKLPFVQVSAE